VVATTRAKHQKPAEGAKSEGVSEKELREEAGDLAEDVRSKLKNARPRTIGANSPRDRSRRHLPVSVRDAGPFDPDDQVRKQRLRRRCF
jgi:hypothetical protein